MKTKVHPWDQRSAGMFVGFDKDGNRVAFEPVSSSTEVAPIVSMCEHKGQLFVATSEGVYRLNGDKFERLLLEEEQERPSVLERAFTEEPITSITDSAMKKIGDA